MKLCINPRRGRGRQFYARATLGYAVAELASASENSAEPHADRPQVA
jgi:hypothetical protein